MNPGGSRGAIFMKFFLSSCCAVFLFLLGCGAPSAGNNIEFLDKVLIRELSHGIYEVVIPKLESGKITYAKELPFDKLDFAERNEKYHSIGTAFFINEKELMTAEHVFGLMYFSLHENFFIRDADGKVYPVNKVHKYSTRRDMLVFDLKKYPEKITSLKFNRQVEIGDTVFSAGNAQGEGIAYRAGQVASFTPERAYGQWKDIRFSSPASPGNSGGPLLNVQGEVVGLIVKKNKSENYNIAVPVNEFDNLTDKAELHARNVTVEIKGTDASLIKDWSYTLPLPATVADLARQARNALDSFYKSLGKKITAQVKEKNFPRGERFRYYLRNQSVIHGFASIVPDINFNKWQASRHTMEKEPLSADQNVYHGRSPHFDVQVIVEKPPGTDLKTFLDSPKMILDTLFKAVPYFRHVGEDKVRITSFGEPEEKIVWRDNLGRTWTSSLWYMPYADYFLYSHCLPYPKGALCNITDDSTGILKLDHFASSQEACDELVVGYKGDIDDWVEYFALEAKYLPTFFQQAKISRDDKRLRVKLKDFSIDFKNPEITGESSLRLHFGYANDRLLAEDLILFSLFPQKGSSAHYSVRPFFESSPFSPDSYTTAWQESSTATGDFSGKKVNRRGQVVIRKTVLHTEKTITTPLDQKIKNVFTVGCYYKASRAEEGIEQDCEQFFQGVEFVDR
jgi:hypothetical protein